MHHTKTDSDATTLSLTASSPPRSPPRRPPLYFVQSPSHDSTPNASPPHSHSSVGRHSRESSSTRFSGSLKPHATRKVSPNDVALHKFSKSWDKQFNIIEEEGLLDDDRPEEGIPRRCYVLAFLICFLVLFFLFALILYGASKPQKPKVTIKSITFERFVIHAGSDFTGVATDMASMNSTLKFTYRNTATFFGLHVTSTPIDLLYSQIAIGSGTMEKFYQPRKSQRSITVMVMGDKIPLYGSGVSLRSSTGMPVGPVPLKLRFVTRSRAYVLGKLVKPKFYDKIECSLNFDPKKMNVPVSLQNRCKFL